MERKYLKEKLKEAMVNVTDSDFDEAFVRWMSGFNAESMLDNFISILEEYKED